MHWKTVQRPESLVRHVKGIAKLVETGPGAAAASGLSDQETACDVLHKLVEESACMAGVH
jgi:hypothetical protein